MKGSGEARGPIFFSFLSLSYSSSPRRACLAEPGVSSRKAAAAIAAARASRSVPAASRAETAEAAAGGREEAKGCCWRETDGIFFLFVKKTTRFPPFS